MGEGEFFLFSVFYCFFVFFGGGWGRERERE